MYRFMKLNKELLHAIIDHLHLAISHQPGSQQPNYKIRNSERKIKLFEIRNKKRKKKLLETASSSTCLGVCLRKTLSLLFRWCLFCVCYLCTMVSLDYPLFIKNIYPFKISTNQNIIYKYNIKYQIM